MTKGEAVNWIINLSADIGKVEHQSLWHYEQALSEIREMLENEELRTGKWQITDAYPHNVYCSKCHTKFAQTHWEVWEDGSLPRRFCPNCGARMQSE